MHTPSRIVKVIFRRASGIVRNIKFYLLSTNDHVKGKPTRYQAIQMVGKGRIIFEENVRIGFVSSPGFWSTYCYLESRNASSNIVIGENTWINNGFAAIAERCSIKIGRNCLIGHDVVILDSNFHSLNPTDRHNNGHVEAGDVEICENVFIGSRAIVLKNSVIGEGCVIAAGAVVSGVFPSNCIIAGNPAVIKRRL